MITIQNTFDLLRLFWYIVRTSVPQSRFTMNTPSHAQNERLYFIDFRVYFLGTITRAHLTQRFNTKSAAATRDLALYRELAPDNLAYDETQKQYVMAETFSPLFEHSVDRVLTALTKGYGESAVLETESYILSDLPMRLNVPDIEVLAALSRAIYGKYPVEIGYRSTSSGLSTREIIPFGLIDTGLRWHVRAYDRKRQRFADFVLTRITEIEELLDSPVGKEEDLSNDIQWNRIVELEIKAHPRLKHKKTIEFDYQMKHGVLRLNVRAAEVGYLLRRWNIDCTKDASLEGAEYQLWLSNTPALYGVENLAIAPGYQQPI